MWLIQQYFKQEPLLDPCDGCSFFMVRAVEIEPEVVEEVKTELTIEEIVREVFGKDSENALKIMQCESRGNPETIGDTHIMTYHSGELVGDSIGLFQIRSGGHDFNRAKANKMTADEFRTWMKDPESNIKYAKTIFDRRGWFAWFNCMNKVLK